MRKQWLSALAAVAAGSGLWLAGCGPDLGECDETMLGGSADPTAPRPHAAQSVINASCASGRCHSATAEGDARAGAPADLNFDVVPASTAFEEISKVQDGAAVVQDRREDIWAAIDSGEMPPPRPEGSGAMSAANKETVRNWLACGAEVIATPAAVDPTADAFTTIYTMMRGMTCQGCHLTGSAMGGFLPTDDDACAAHDAIVGGMASGPECGSTGALLVQPMNPGGSLLLDKLKNRTPRCGQFMPMGGQAPLGETAEGVALVQMLEAWIAAGAPAPDGCP